MAWDYSDKVRELFLNAVSKTDSYFGSIPDPDAMGHHGSISCGDAIVFYLKIESDPDDPKSDRIVKARYETFGCTSAIASSEALCAIVETKKLSPLEALSITNQEIVEYLGGMPDEKLHCSIMGAQVLENTIEDWAKKRGVELGNEIFAQLEDPLSRTVCTCFELSERDIQDSIRTHNLTNLEQVKDVINAGGACGTCVEGSGGLMELLDRFKEGNDQCETSLSPGPTSENLNIKNSVFKVTEKRIRPVFWKHGSDIEIIEVKNNLVYCLLGGDCTKSPQSELVMKNTVERFLKEQVDNSICVICV